MKLKNKLLPLVGVATACAAVAPLALTSCKSDNGFKDMTQKYVATCGYHSSTAYTTNAGLTEYCENLVANPEIFADDFYWSAYSYNKFMSGKMPGKAITISVNTDYEKISDFSVRKIKDPNGDDFYGISFTREFEVEIERNELIRSNKETYNGSIKYVDIPLSVYYDTSYYTWNFYVDLDYLGYIWTGSSTNSSIGIELNYSLDVKTAEISRTENINFSETINKRFTWADMVNKYKSLDIWSTVYSVLEAQVQNILYSHWFWRVTCTD